MASVIGGTILCIYMCIYVYVYYDICSIAI